MEASALVRGDRGAAGLHHSGRHNVLYYHKRAVAIAPHWSGKVCTVTQMFALGWIMLKWIPLPPAWPCAVAAVFTLWSSVVYIRQGIDILRDPANS